LQQKNRVMLGERAIPKRSAHNPRDAYFWKVPHTHWVSREQMKCLQEQEQAFSFSK
jgi:hypothetical protein